MSNYIGEIVNAFLSRRRGVMMVSPLDYGVIDEWEKQEIPLHVVLRSINEVFDKLDDQPARFRPAVKTIKYCSEVVEDNFQNWLEMQVGK